MNDQGSTKLAKGTSKRDVVVALPTAQQTRAPALRITHQFFRFRLRNGFIGEVFLSEKEIDRLWYRVQQPDEFHQFIVFDSDDRRFALNIQHVVASQFDYFGEIGLVGKLIEGGETVDIMFADSRKWLQLEIDPDEMTIEQFDKARIDDNDLCQLANLFFYFDSSHDGSDYAERLRDCDGSIIWLRLNDISVASAPLDLFPKKRKRRSRKQQVEE